MPDYSLLDPTYEGKLPSYLKTQEDLDRYVTKTETESPGFKDYFSKQHPTSFFDKAVGEEPIARTPRYSAEMEGLDRTAPTATEETDIRESMRTRMQSQIDAVDKMYASMITREEEAGEERLGRTRAIGARAGLIGSPRGEAQKEKTKEYTKGQIGLIEEERQVKIEGILTKIDERAEKEIQFKRMEAFGQQEKYETYLKETYEDNKSDWTELAQSGITLDRIKENKEYYAQALEELNMSESEFDFFFESKKPQAEQLDYSEIQYQGDNGNLWLKRIGFDPVTGEKKEYNYDMGLPYAEAQVEEIEMVNGIPYKVIKDENGKVVRYEKVEGIEGEAAGYAPTSDMKEFDYAKRGGYTGTFEDWTGKGGTDKDEWSNARNFIEKNPEASKEELVIGIKENTENLSDSDIDDIVAASYDPVPFLTRDYFKETFSTSELESEAKTHFLGAGWVDFTDLEMKQAAKAAGHHGGGFLGIGTGTAGVKKYIDSLVEQYLDYLEKSVQGQRDRGLNDEEILKQMQ